MSDEIKKIADHFGERKQLCLLMEEAGEMIQAANKVLRASDGDSEKSRGESIISLAEEIADVQMVIAQVEYLLNIEPDTLKQIQDFKTKRVGKAIERENSKKRETE